MANSDYNSGKASAVKIFMVLSCIACIVGGIASIAGRSLVGGILMLVSLIWVLPMTVYAFRRLNRHEYIGIGFKICTLIFHNLIAGIILLCMNTEGESKEEKREAPDNKPTVPSRTPVDTSTQQKQPQKSPIPESTTNQEEKAVKSKSTVIIFSRALYRRYLIDMGYSVVTPSGNPSTVDDYCHRIDFVCDVENIEWADIPKNIYRLLQEYDYGGGKQNLGAKSNNSVINALKRADECIQKLSL